MIPEKLHKYFLPYELALRMKNIGFSEPCFDYFANGNPQNALDISYNSDDLIRDFESIARPTFSQAFSWFREKYGLYDIISKNSYMVEGEINGEFLRISVFSLKSHEEAELACLDKLLEIVEQKQK